MKHAKTLGIKLVVNIIVVYSIFGIFGNASLINLFWISLLVTGIAYLIGDLVILPRYGNAIATLADFPLAFLSLWILGSLLLAVGTPIVTTSLFAAFFISVAEPLIHAYLESHDTATKSNRPPIPTRLQTEFAEETDAQDIMKKKKKKKDDDSNFTGYY
ncbi:DUF2512 family protein [Ornithinibacillus sp. L9]|uniref:DUF2512 family protein n=1 Tax=Ornithinibacillus caprae TaxID=2678566 RepID=A0A6N8FN41_9BACI|nr:YndM family protein [Ornithinibacillus caprae]MUK90196.1 DUF2512 family protein [Ornithinibacillus caprae]